MKCNKQFLIGTIVAAAVLAVILSIALYRQTDREVMSVNGSQVFQEEFSMLLQDNLLIYEQQLRQELLVPEEQTLLEFLEGDFKQYNSKILEKNVQQLTRLRVQQELAKQYSVVSEFSYQQLVATMENENALRTEKQQRGDLVFGTIQFSIEQYYGRYMDNLARETLAAIPETELTVTDQEIEDYYLALPGPAGVEGELTRISAFVITDSEGRTPSILELSQNELAAAIEQTEGGVKPSQGLSVRSERHTLTPEALRSLVRQDPAIEDYLYTLPLDELSTPLYLEEQLVILRYEGFSKAPILQENEKDAIRQQLRRERYQQWIDQQAEEAAVVVNQHNLPHLEKQIQ